MLPIGRPLTDRNRIIVRVGVTKDGLPSIDNEKSVLDRERKPIVGIDGRPVLMCYSVSTQYDCTVYKARDLSDSDSSEDELSSLEVVDFESLTEDDDVTIQIESVDVLLSAPDVSDVGSGSKPEKDENLFTAELKPLDSIKRVVIKRDDALTSVPTKDTDSRLVSVYFLSVW